MSFLTQITLKTRQHIKTFIADNTRLKTNNETERLAGNQSIQNTVFGNKRRAYTFISDVNVDAEGGYVNNPPMFNHSIERNDSNKWSFRSPLRESTAFKLTQHMQ
eukprot:641246_1